MGSLAGSSVFADSVCVGAGLVVPAMKAPSSQYGELEKKFHKNQRAENFLTLLKTDGRDYG